MSLDMEGCDVKVCCEVGNAKLLGIGITFGMCPKLRVDLRRGSDAEKCPESVSAL